MAPAQFPAHRNWFKKKTQCCAGQCCGSKLIFFGFGSTKFCSYSDSNP
jgi:hypothetical protein